MRAMAKTTEDVDAGQSFSLWRPQYEKVERLQTKIMSGGHQAEERPPGSPSP